MNPLIEIFAGNSGKSCGGFFSENDIISNKTDLNKKIYRDNKLVIREEFFGLLIYDRKFKEAYQLNNDASIIFRTLNGLTILELSDKIKINKNKIKIFLEKLDKLALISNSEQNSKIYDFRTGKEKNYLATPAKIYWIITKACNMNCKHCFTSSKIAMQNELNTEEMKDIIKQLAKMKVFQISLGGGEPFLKKDILEIAKYANKLGIDIYTPTNGLNMTNELAKKIKNSGFYYIEVSIDGINSKIHDNFRCIPGAYNKALNAIKILVKNNINTKMISVINKQNCKLVPELIKFAESLNVSGMRLLRFRPSGRGKENEDELNMTFQEYKEAFRYNSKKFNIIKDNFFNFTSKSKLGIRGFGCPGGKYVMMIGETGYVRPCGFYPPGKFICGNTRNQKIFNIWQNSKTFQKFRELKPKENSCKNCKFLDKCNGGCRSAAYSTFKDITSPDFMCPYLNKDEKSYITD